MAAVAGIMVNSGTMMKANFCGHSWGLSPNIGFRLFQAAAFRWDRLGALSVCLAHRAPENVFTLRADTCSRPIIPILGFVHLRHSMVRIRQHEGHPVATGIGRVAKSHATGGAARNAVGANMPPGVKALNMFSKIEVDATDMPALTAAFLSRLSIEITPRQIEKVALLRNRLPQGTCVYVALIDPADLALQIEAISAIRAAGLEPVPHVPARFVRDRSDLEHRLTAFAQGGKITPGAGFGRRRAAAAWHL